MPFGVDWNNFRSAWPNPHISSLSRAWFDFLVAACWPPTLASSASALTAICANAPTPGKAPFALVNQLQMHSHQQPGRSTLWPWKWLGHVSKAGLAGWESSLVNYQLTWKEGLPRERERERVHKSCDIVTLWLCKIVDIVTLQLCDIIFEYQIFYRRAALCRFTSG